jgi:glycosyltransferase involved in cell wall biosynthesis
MRTSVIIPALNEAENLALSLPHVRLQLGPIDELIVVDNGSRDNTAAVAEKLGAQVFHEPIRGRSYARNLGIRKSQGDLVVFLDADCTPQREWLSELLKPFEDPATGCVAGAFLNFIATSTPFSDYLVRKGHLAQAVYFNHPFRPFAATGNAAFRRAVLDRIGLFDEALWTGQDADLSWRMQLETSYKVAAAPLALVSHREDLSFRGFLKQKRRHAQGAVLLYKKYRRYRQKEVASFKEVYWEYRSILKRGFACAIHLSASRLGFVSRRALDKEYQLLIEIGEKLGRLEGSIRNRVWYP